MDGAHLARRSIDQARDLATLMETVDLYRERHRYRRELRRLLRIGGHMIYPTTPNGNTIEANLALGAGSIEWRSRRNRRYYGRPYEPAI